MIKAVLWDIDGTLLNFYASEAAAIRSCFRIFGLGECTDDMLSDYSGINTEFWHMMEAGRISKPVMLVERFREFFRRYGLDETKAEAFNAEYQYRLSDTIAFSDGAEEVLLALKGRVIQCAVTNGTKTAQEGKLRNSGMDRIFDMIFISEDIGFEKPRREYFDAVLSELPGLSAEEIMIVGDSLSSDIKGGHDAGIVTCWYDPHGQDTATDIPIDYTIRDLRDVLRITGVRPEAPSSEDRI